MSYERTLLILKIKGRPVALSLGHQAIGDAYQYVLERAAMCALLPTPDCYLERYDICVSLQPPYVQSLKDGHTWRNADGTSLLRFLASFRARTTYRPGKVFDRRLVQVVLR
jgi:hypothetical protein